MITKIKKGQVWVNKKDGRLLTVGNKHDSIRWNCTDSVSRRSHATPEYEIVERYRILDNAIAAEINKKVDTAQPIVLSETEKIIIRTKPWWIPKKMFNYLVDWVIVARSKKVFIKDTTNE